MRLKAFSVSIHLQSSYIAAIGTTPTPNMDRNCTAIVHGFSLVSRHKNNHGIKAKPLFNFNTYNGMMPSDYSSYNYDYETIFNIWHCTSSNTIMPLINIDYSPNSQACCQSCQSKIAISEIRVVVMDMSPYQKGDIIRTYYHVNCYSNPYISIIPKQLDDVQNLSKENWMDGERKRSPQKNYVEDFIAIPASTPSRISNTTVTNRAADEGIPTSAEWNVPDSIAMTPENSDPTVITPSRIASPPIVVNPYMREKCLTITGLKYGQVCAYRNQNVLLARDPNNKYDANAVKVTNLDGKSIGHIKKEQAKRLSSILNNLDINVVAECTVIDDGDGYTQKLICVFRQKMSNSCVSVDK